MEIVLLILFLAWLGSGSGRRWFPWRGAPNVSTLRQANNAARRRSRRLRAEGRFASAILIRLGALVAPLEVFDKPTVIFGSPGAGKTSLLNMIYPGLVRLFDIGVGRTRMVFLDVKNELAARLHAILPDHVPIYILNPFDARFAPLVYPSAFRSRADLVQLAHALCPALAGDQAPFFRDWARLFIWAVAWSFTLRRFKARRPWTLADLYCVCIDRNVLRRVLSFDPETRSLYKASLHPRTKSSGDVFSTLRSVMQPFAEVALAELKATNRFDLTRFHREDGVVLLGIPPKNSRAVMPLYSLLVPRMVEEARTISHPDDRFVLGLDELGLFDRGVVDSLVTATAVGRSHGIHLFASTQSVELLEDRLGAEKAHAFLGSCPNLVGFRCASKKTADYVVSRFGAQEGILLLYSSSSGPQGGSSTTSQQFVTRPTVTPEDLLHLPLADPVRDRLEFYAASPAFGTVRAASRFVQETTVPLDPNFPNVVPNDLSGGSLAPLTDADLEELGFDGR